MRKLFFLTISSLLFFSFSKPETKQQTILIRLFASYTISSLSFNHVSGDYEVKGDGLKLFDADKISFITVSLAGDSVLVQKPNFSGKFHEVKFVPKAEYSSRSEEHTS